MAAPKKPIPYQIVDGIRFPLNFLKSCLTDALNYKPRPDDNIISTYPKCGTTWMQMVVIQIFRKGEPFEEPEDFKISTPFFEMFGHEGLSRMPRPGLIKTHLGYNRMPYSPEAKYIYVIRNPCDVCVSLYHHTYLKPGFNFWDGSFDDFFELFMSGEVEYNDYFDHLMSWYPHRNDPNVYWTTYELMKKDLKKVVLEVAEFLGDEYKNVVQNDNNVMNNILRHSDFTYMKEIYAVIEENRRKRENRYKDMPKCLESKSASITSHIRKGVVGDWKEYFSDEQFQRMKKKFELKTAGTDIGSWWPDLFEL